MIQLNQISQINQALPSTESIKRILVPTMGALHEGHFALIHKAKEMAGDNGIVIVTIFVNPIQFDRSADLESYPRPLDADLAHCQRLGVDLVFTPHPDELYHPDRSINVTENQLSKQLCGATRPGHFDGVCTIITKLFNLFQPTAAIFGEKDYQQLAIIRRLKRDLNYNCEIIGHPIVREPSGLALSSRNKLLTPENRALAPEIHASLDLAQQLFHSGVTNADKLLATIRLNLIKSTPNSKIDYLECVCAETLQPISEIDRPAVIAIAVFFGKVRLIDNISLNK